MFKALGFSRGGSEVSLDSKASTPSVSVNLLDDAISLERGLKVMDMLMDDRMNETQNLLQDDNSAFSKLATGVIHFIEAILGFEPEVIKRASDSLYEAEQAAYKERQKALKSGKVSSSSFPPGMEYSIAYAEAQLLSAITLFLSESMIDSAKALYRLRKAYQTFDEVNRQLDSSSLKDTLSRQKSASTPNLLHKGGLSSRSSMASLRGKVSVDDGILTSESLKIPEIASRAKRFHQARLERSKALTGDKDDQVKLVEKALADLSLEHNINKRAGQDTVDEYIVSAINACYGLLQLVISIIPPGIGRVLSIVGFSGDKDEALSMLWKATTHQNIHGCIGLLALLQFYDGPTQVSDIEVTEVPSSPASDETATNDLPIPSNFDDITQVKKCLKAALARYSKHYSHGALWQLQQGRMKASEGKLKEAVAIMDDTSRGPINLRQVEGLMLFDKTMFIIALHGYETAAPNYLRLINLNSWSHMLYTYLAGICHVELYRANIKTDPKRAAEEKKKAIKCFEDAPTFMGKKKILSKPMPFDIFVLRKLKQWKEIAAANNVDLVDAIGTSPSHEIIYFWNGFGKMPEEDLDLAMKILGYSAQEGTPYANSTVSPLVLKETEEESCVRYLLQSIALRNQKKVTEGYELLKKHVLPKIMTEAPEKGHFKSGLPKFTFIKKHKEPWLAPSAIYEMAVFEWTLHGTSKVQLVKDYLELSNSWGDDYELSTRVGLRTKSALSRIEELTK